MPPHLALQITTPSPRTQKPCAEARGPNRQLGSDAILKTTRASIVLLTFY